jgi:hypothetical protein
MEPTFLLILIRNFQLQLRSIVRLIEIDEKLNVSESEHIGFYEIRGKIVVRKIE